MKNYVPESVIVPTFTIRRTHAFIGLLIGALVISTGRSKAFGQGYQTAIDTVLKAAAETAV